MTFKIPLFDYQEKDAENLSKRDFCLLNSELGTGKTIILIATALKLKKDKKVKECLIVCPNALKRQWGDEIEKFTNEKYTIIEGKPSERLVKYNSIDFFKITSYELLRMDFDFDIIKQRRWGVVILDEITKIKSYSTKTSQNAKRIPRLHRYGATGILIEKSPLDLHSIFQFLHPLYFGNYWKFNNNYVIWKEMKMGHRKWWEPVGYRNLDELKEKLEKVSIKRTQREVLPFLPKLIVRNLKIEFSEKEAKIYEKLKEMFYRDLKNEYGKKIFRKLIYLRMACDSVATLKEASSKEVKSLINNIKLKNSSKLLELKSLVEDLIEENKKIIIFTSWIRTQKEIAKYCSDIKTITINGELNNSEKYEKLKQFFSTGSECVLLTTDCLTYGMNLQEANTLINFDLPYSWAQYQQRIGRVYREGQKSQVNVFNLIIKDTIEEKILKILDKKEDFYKKLIQGGTQKIKDYV